MSVLNRDQIKQVLGESVIIHPYEEKNLKGIGYNFRVGPMAWSANTKKQLDVVQKDGYRAFLVNPDDVALVMTRECISVDGTIAGTFHSKVDKVSTGFSHISTTLDPNWIGPLLIAIANQKNHTLDLRIDDTFITLIFYKVTESQYGHSNPGGRTDILQKLGVEASERETEWLRQEWRHNIISLKECFEQNFEDVDTFALVEFKLKKTKEKKWYYRKRAWVTIATLVFVLLAGGAGYLWLEHDSEIGLFVVATIVAGALGGLAQREFRGQS